MAHRLLLTSMVTSVFVAYSVAQKGIGNYYCPRDSVWHLGKFSGSPYSSSSEMLCYSVMNARSHEEALRHCHKHQASLLAIVNNPEDPDSGSSLLDFLANNSVPRTWYGYYISDDRLRKDAFPITQLEELRRMANIPWLINSSSPADSEPQGISDCFVETVNVSCPLDGYLGREFQTLPTNYYLSTPPTVNASEQPATRRKRSADGPELPFLRTVKLWATLASLGSDSERKTRVKRQDGAARCQRYSVQSAICQQRLPFVCVKLPLVTDVDAILSPLPRLCQDDEVGNIKIDRCFSFGAERMNYSTAQARCEAKDPDGQKTGTLYRHFREATSFSILVVNALINSLNLNETEQQGSLAWVSQVPEDTEMCLAVNLGTADILSWDCQAQLPFHICQRDVSFPDLQNLTIEIHDQQQKMQLQTERIPGSPDMQVWLPQRFTEPPETALSELLCRYGSTLVPGLQSMILVKRGIPMAQSSTLQQSLYTRNKRQSDGFFGAQVKSPTSTEVRMVLQNGYTYITEIQKQNIRNMTDYYWCEVNDLKTGLIQRSGRLFVRTEGVEMYAVSIAITGESRAEMLKGSLQGDETNGRIGQNSLRFTNFTYSVLRYRSGPVLNYKCESIQCPKFVTGTIVDFHFFNKTIAGPNNVVNSHALQTAESLIRDGFSAASMQEDLLPGVFDITTLQVKSIDICPSTTVHDPVSRKTYIIPDTNLGEVFTSKEICLSNGEPYVRLVCLGDKLYGTHWSEFESISGCQFDSAATSAGTATLKNISESDINELTLPSVMLDTINAVRAIDTFVAVDIVYVADILQKSAQLLSVSEENVGNILGLVDVVSGINQTVLQESNELGNATNRILRAIDALGDKIPLGDNVTSVRVVSKSMGLEVWNLHRVTNDVIIGLELQLEGGEPKPVLAIEDLVSIFDSNRPAFTNTDAAIFLPSAFIRMLQGGNSDKKLRLSMNVFADTTLFQAGHLQLHPNRFSATAQLNSRVIAARVTVEGVPVTRLGDHGNVTTVYLPVVKLSTEMEHTANSTCVFWNFEGARGQGAWSREGCKYHRTMEGRDVCMCDHLTNFAVLMDVYGQSALPDNQQLALSVITIIGLSLSIAGLACTALSFIFIRKLRQGKPQQTLFNMALAMLASWVIFLAGFERVENYIGCLVVAVLLHYFILASFMWMLMEGLLQYLLFVKVLGTHFERYLLKTAIPAWGLPLIPVIIVLAIDTDLYHGGDHYCWMALMPFYFAFLTPVALIMAVNIVVYIMVVVNICRRGNVGNNSSSSGGSSKTAVGIRASVACFVVLGLSWIFAFLAVEDARVIFQYLFTVTASLQGFLIFLIFTARDPAVRSFWRQALCRCCPGMKTKQACSTNYHGKSKGRDDCHTAKSDQLSLTTPQLDFRTSGSTSSDDQPPNGRTVSSISALSTSQLSTSITHVKSDIESDFSEVNNHGYGQ